MDEVRERILRAARFRFFRLGFARVTMDALAAELGMSKKTLYRHFRRKEDVIDVLIARKAGAIRAGFEAILAATDRPFSERAAGLVQHALAELNEISPVFLHDLQRFTPASYARVEEFRRQIAPQFWERLVTEGIAAGAVRPGVEPAFVARFFLVSAQSLLLPENLDYFGLPPGEVMARFLQLLMAGLLTPSTQADYEHNRPFVDLASR